MTQPPSYPGSGEDNNDLNQPPPTHQQYGNPQPYGQQPQPGQYGDPNQQYGQPAPYGQWQGGNDVARPNDGVSIAAFVLSLTCCLSLVGVIMAFFGLSRTKGGKRRGRWAAIAAIPVGILLTLVTGSLIALGIWGWNQIVTLDNAEVGQCINIDEDTEDTNDDVLVMMTKADCDSSHDGQVVYAGTVGQAAAAVGNGTPDLTDASAVQEICSSLAPPKLTAQIDETHSWRLVAEELNDPQDNDRIVCYVEKSDGSKLKSKLGD